MLITDHSKEQALLGVQRLRTMASSASPNLSSVATELSMSLSSSATPIKPSPTRPPLQLDLLPLYPSPSPSNPNLNLTSISKSQHYLPFSNPKLFFSSTPLDSFMPSLREPSMGVNPSSLMQSSSSLTHITPSSVNQSNPSVQHSLLQAGALALNPSYRHSSKGVDVNAPTSNNHQASRVDIDVNQVPSSSESDDDAEDEGGCPSMQFSESVNNNRLHRGGLSAMEYSPTSTKREREKMGSENNMTTTNSNNNMFEVSSRASDEEEGGSTRKKLRLSKEQSALLEESFKEHSTLNPKQKNALAKQLSLRPRQVEVWFQNRRARTKLKQTEVDCELLKRCCESLTEENRRLQKEVQELRALKVGAPCVIAHDFYMPLPAATLTMCPSCERLATLDPASRPASKQLALAFNPHHPQPSAAC